MSKLILKLSINEETKRFEIEDKFIKLRLDEMNTVIGAVTMIYHNYINIAAQKQNEFILKRDINE